MDIEQTHQLLQLILNGVVMVVACVFLLAGLLRRHSAVSDRLQQTQEVYEYVDWLRQLDGFRDEIRAARTQQRLDLLKRQLEHLRQQCRSTHHSVIAIHYALLLLLSSTLLIALRTLVAMNSLIVVALVLFVAGIGVQLLAVGLTLNDLHTAHRSLWEMLRQVLVWDEQRHDRRRHRSRPPAQRFAKPAPRSTRSKAS
jgi:hypothetical protein